MQLSNLQSALSPDVAGTFFVKEIEFMTDKSSAVALRKEKKKKSWANSCFGVFAFLKKISWSLIWINNTS